jgi:hypothetical protein
MAEGDGNDVVKADPGAIRDFDGAGQDDIGLGEHAVDAEPPGLVCGDIVSDLVRCPAIGPGCARISRLRGRVVGDFGLIEVGAATVTAPEDLELLVVFDEKSVGGNVVAVDDKAVDAGVGVPADPGAVIGAPDPGVIDNRVVTVQFKIRERAAGTGSADAEEDVVKRDGILLVAYAAAAWPDLKQYRRLLWARIEEQAGDDDAISVGGGHGCGTVDGLERSETKAKDDGVGTRDVSFRDI